MPAKVVYKLTVHTFVAKAPQTKCGGLSTFECTLPAIALALRKIVVPIQV